MKCKLNYICHMNVEVIVVNVKNKTEIIALHAKIIYIY